MGTKIIDRLIINTPYDKPKMYWKYRPEYSDYELVDGRRPAGYVVASEQSMTADDPGTFVSIEQVNRIREKVDRWRESGYPGVSGITKRLLEHWYDADAREGHQFFFCQLEAMETLIWLTEAPAAEKVGLNISNDGGPFQRYCSKMATGSGKTIVMTMLIAWQILNKVTNPQDHRFSKNIFVVAPGLTVKSRLSVLIPESEGNYYEAFNVVPTGLAEKLRQGRVKITNWQALNWETEDQLKKKHSVDKRGPKSDEAYVREVLAEMSNASNIIVINDEAHHAWRIPPEDKREYEKDEIEEATIWMEGLNRIDNARGILTCYDFTATPFIPSGKKSRREALYTWIVSDFGLNDAIESGLVKTPRMVVRSEGRPDSKTLQSKLYHIYEHVKIDLNRRAEKTEPLGDLITNAYDLLGFDWLELKKKWAQDGHLTPPVMISVVNRTETAARVEYAFKTHQIHVDELCDPEGILHIDSKVLEMAEESVDGAGQELGSSEDVPTEKLSKKEQAELLRKMVDTIGQPGKPGEQIQNVISVGMLSEGWDARTVTHIMGLRAFTSQLLCEQVVGRGLRRTDYEVDPKTKMFSPEYVNIFGVPFSFLPHESHETTPIEQKTRFIVQPDPEKSQYEITWPNVIRIERKYKKYMSLDVNNLKPLVLDAGETIISAEMSPLVDGKLFYRDLTEIDLEKLAGTIRMQNIIFRAAEMLYEQMKDRWMGVDQRHLLAQLTKFMQDFILRSDKLKIAGSLDQGNELRRRILIMLNMTKVAQHVAEEVTLNNAESIEPVLDSEKPIRSTADMQTWWTTKDRINPKKSHINLCVCDSPWEAEAGNRMDSMDVVTAWVKNDHLGFEVFYLFKGMVHRYRPDFIIKLKNGVNLILEVKGEKMPQDETKWKFLDEWVRAVNAYGRFGYWSWDVAEKPEEITDIIIKESQKVIEK